MKKNLLVLSLISIILIYSSGIRAQCIYYPADCPSDRQLPDSADRYGNPLVPEEVSMEIRLHDYLTDEMQKLAEKNRWEVYQYDETDGSGYLNAERTGPLVFNLRPPHDYEIAFIMIVNKDSMNAWKESIKDWNERFQEEVEKMKTSQSVAGMDKMRVELEKKNISFRNACMLRIKIGINQESAIVSSVTEDIHFTRQLHVPHAVLAIEVHNDKIDDHAIFDLDQFKRCTDLAFILMGDWNPKPNSYQRYYPGYNNEKKNTDLVTLKTLPCDRVRTLVLHVEGSPRYIQEFINSLDEQRLNQLIVR